MIDCNEDHNIFIWRTNDEHSYLELEWFDGLDTIIDAGFDKPTVEGICQTFIDPIEYIDVLADERPSESFYRITEYGDRKHPGMVVVRDLDEN